MRISMEGALHTEAQSTCLHWRILHVQAACCTLAALAPKGSSLKDGGSAPQLCLLTPIVFNTECVRLLKHAAGGIVHTWGAWHSFTLGISVLGLCRRSIYPVPGNSSAMAHNRHTLPITHFII